MNGKRDSETSSAYLISGVVYSQNMHLILSDLPFLSIGKRTAFVNMLVSGVGNRINESVFLRWTQGKEIKIGLSSYL